MKNVFYLSLKVILSFSFLFVFSQQALLAQSSCPAGISAFASGLPIDGTSNCTFTVEVEWVKQSANNSSLQLVLLVDGSDEFDDGINCDIPNITTPTGVPQIYTFPNSFVADCNADISVTWVARTNQTCGGGNCGSNTLVAVVALPVELAYFKARTERASVLLDWHTISEQDNQYFAIEHSVDGRTFQEVGKVEGKGTTSESMYYQFTDKSPVKGINYYRLKQVDYSGQFAYSDIESLYFNDEDVDVKVMPTFAENEIRVVFYENFLSQTSIEVFDIQGDLLLNQKLPEGENELVLDIDKWIAGQYFIRIRYKNEFILRRFVKIE